MKWQKGPSNLEVVQLTTRGRGGGRGCPQAAKAQRREPAPEGQGSRPQASCLLCPCTISKVTQALRAFLDAGYIFQYLLDNIEIIKYCLRHKH